MGKNKKKPDDGVYDVSEITYTEDNYPIIGGVTITRLLGDYETYERLASDDDFRRVSDKPRSANTKKIYRTMAKMLREKHEAQVAWELKASQYRTDAHYTIARLVDEVEELKKQVAELSSS